MRLLLAISFCLLLSLGTFSDFVKLSCFKINQNHITATHCVNEDSPEEECEGSCYLTCQINQVEDEQDETPYPTENIDTKLNLYSSVYDIDLSSTDTEQRVKAFYTENKLKDRPRDIFKPPA